MTAGNPESIHNNDGRSDTGVNGAGLKVGALLCPAGVRTGDFRQD